MNLLDFVNRVLQKIGEEEVTSVLQNRTASECAQVCRDSVVQVAQHFSTWPWLHRVLAADSWNDEEATLDGNVLTVYRVRDLGSKREVRYITEDQYYRQELSSYTGTIGGSESYTIIGDKFYFNPYPNDSDSRQNIRFDVSIIPVLPTTDTGVIDVPVRDELLLIYRAAADLCVEHLRDGELAQAYDRKFLSYLTQAKTRLVTEMKDTRRSAIW